jgi:hypothetical protein
MLFIHDKSACAIILQLFTKMAERISNGHLQFPAKRSRDRAASRRPGRSMNGLGIIEPCLPSPAEHPPSGPAANLSVVQPVQSHIDRPCG